MSREKGAAGGLESPSSSKRAGRASLRGRAAPKSRKTVTKKPSTPPLGPEEILLRAMQAKTPRSRGIWARRGLSLRRALDRTTHAMLMRQLYLSHYEQRRFRQALDAAEQSLELGVLSDVVHQDAARACVGLGDVEGAVGHLRLAARIGPAKRRAFHWWTLGSLFFVRGRNEEAMAALSRAARWGTTDKPLYQGHLAVVRCATGASVEDLCSLIERLETVPAGQGYGRFVLGHLAFYSKRWAVARRYLESFVRRAERGRPAMAIALEGELQLARQTLASIPPH